MAVPIWPFGVPFEPLRDSVTVTPFGLPPIITEMEQGNVRMRRRPGDSVSIVQQTVRMTRAQVNDFKSWLTDAIGGGTGRFRVEVWNGSAMVSRVCQFHLAQGGIKFSSVPDSDLVDVSMALRVYAL